MTEMLFPDAPVDGQLSLQPNNILFRYDAAKAGWYVSAGDSTKIEQYQTPDYSFASPTLQTFNHGLSKAPDDVQTFLRCISDADGYVAGDVLAVAEQLITRTTGTAKGVTVQATATDLQITAGSAGAFDVLSKGVGGTSAALPANWVAFTVARTFTIGGIPDVTPVGMVVIESKSIFGQAEHGIVLPVGFQSFMLDISLARPATNDEVLWVRTGSDGATPDEGATDYEWQYSSWGGSAQTPLRSQDATRIELVARIGNLSDEGTALTMWVYDPFALKNTRVYASGTLTNQANDPSSNLGSGRRKENAQVNYLEFLFSNGNIGEFTYTLYGLRAAP